MRKFVQVKMFEEEMRILIYFLENTSFQSTGPTVPDSVRQACDFVDNLTECPHGGQGLYSLERAKQSSSFLRQNLNLLN